MQFILLTKTNTFIIGPVATLLGYIMDAIFVFTSWFGVVNIGLGIIIFTIITKLVMVPMTIQQQKYSKMNSIIMPEIQEIQKKYKGKTDNDSMMKQNMELQAVYEKYGVKPAAGCLQLIIQIPILFALYRVVWNIPAYVRSVKDVYQTVVTQLMSIEGYASNADFIKLATANTIKETDLGTANKLIDMMYNFDANEWIDFQKIFPSLQIKDVVEKIESMNSFLGGISLYNSPQSYITNFSAYKDHISVLIVAIAIPVLAGLLQWISTKIINSNTETKGAGTNEDEGVMMQSMRMMTNIMPFMSVVFCFMFSTCIGVYWIISSLATIFVQIYINWYMNRLDINDMVAKNIAKINKKREKMGLPPQKITNVANISTRNITAANEKTQEELEEARRKKEEKIRQSTEYYKSGNAKPGSLAAKANMVKQYNERNNKK